MPPRTKGSKRWWGNLVITGLFLVTVGLIAWKVQHDIRLIRGPSESELRAQLTNSGHLAELEAWAIQQVGQPSATLSMPPNAEEMGLKHVAPLPAGSEVVGYLIPEFGGGFRHRGLLIGNVPEPHHFSNRYNNRWSDNVVYYDEIPQER